MKNLTKNHKIALGVVAVIGLYFAWKEYNKPKEVTIEKVEIEEV